MKKPQKSTYDSNAITVHSGLDGVRSHPAMYLGQLGTRGLYQMFKEGADNFKDELKEVSGVRKALIRYVVAERRVIIADTGRGIPVDVHRKTKMSGLETVLTILHAGAKSGDKTAYGKGSIGVHGVGISVVNALSSEFKAWTFRDGAWYCMHFSKGKTTKKIHRASSPIKWPKRGTIISYVPDESIMPGVLDHKDVMQWCDLNRYFAPISIDLEVIDGKRVIARSYEPSTPERLLRKVMKRSELEPVSPTFTLITPSVRVIASWTGSTQEHINGSVSASPSTGTHTRGLEDAVKQAFATVFKRASKDKEVDVNPVVGLCAILDVSVDQPSFEGQAKTRLATRAAYRLVLDAVTPALIKWLRAHKEDGLKVLEHARAITKLNHDFENRKKLARDTAQGRGRLALPPGMIHALTYPPEQRELYLVEGKSAKGTTSDARMPWQEVLPLKGKPPNIIRKTAKALTNETVKGIVRAIGYDPRNPSRKLRCSKLIILTDADDDGDHIAILLMAAIHKLMPELFQRGMVYFVDAPLFTALNNGRMVTGNNLSEMQKRYGKLTHVNRMKGWGSCEVPVLRTVAFNPESRKLLRLDPPTAKEKVKFEQLMGKESDGRFELLGLE